LSIEGECVEVEEMNRKEPQIEVGLHYPYKGCFFETFSIGWERLCRSDVGQI